MTDWTDEAEMMLLRGEELVAQEATHSRAYERHVVIRKARIIGWRVEFRARHHTGRITSPMRVEWKLTHKGAEAIGRGQ